MALEDDQTYAALHVTTNFTFLEGASHPEELVASAKALGLAALAITDRNSLAGVVRAFAEAKKLDQPILIGAEIVLMNGETLIALPTDRAAYGRLTRLITCGRRRAEKGACILYEDDVIAHREGILWILVPPDQPGEDFAGVLKRWQGALGDQLWLALRCLFTEDERARMAFLHRLAGEVGVPLVAANPVLMHDQSRRPLADVLTAIKEKCVLEALGFKAQKNAERDLKPPGDMARLMADYPEALAETLRIQARIRFSLDEIAYDYPREVAAGKDPGAELERLVTLRLGQLYPRGAPEKVAGQIEHELAVIRELKFAPYFLTVYDIVRFARSRGILCQGRGSAANSVLCFLLGITAIDPERIDMVFERFVSSARDEPPDIDVDFEHERREEVIQYLYEKYGRERAALAATVISFRGRSAVRQVGKVFGFSEDRITLLASRIWGWSSKSVSDERVREAGLDPDEPRLRQCLTLTSELIGFPRHLSQHVGGFVLTDSRLDEIVPVENARMEDRTVIEWDKDDLQALGLMKVDVLGLGMLSCIRKAFALLKEHYGRAETLASIEEGDAKVYEMLGRGDSLGLFQVESRAQMSFLPRMKPKNFYDLVIEVAIVRPGPIQGDMVHPYIRRRNGEERVTFPSEAMREVLGKTLGVPLFQEQAMRVAIVGAGFSGAEADQLRRAMATFRRHGTIQGFRDKFLSGMAKNGYNPDFAERCFRQIEGFGDYGFPESHAASFALLVYVSAWLKCHYPAAFACALLNSQPMGFYAPAQIIRDVREHGVTVLPVDVNFSYWDSTLEDQGRAYALRLGFRQIKGLREEECGWITACRANGYREPADLWRRAGLRPAALRRLAEADAFGSLDHHRREALWEVLAIRADKPLPLFEAVGEEDFGAEPKPVLPPMTLAQDLVEDYVTTRLSLRGHPMQFLRPLLPGTCPHGEIIQKRDRSWLSLAGLVICRQRPGTASGTVFITMEDESGTANIILWGSRLEQFRAAVMNGRLLKIDGQLQREGEVMHLIARKVENLSHMLDWLDDERLFPDLPPGQEGSETLKSPPLSERVRPERILPRARHPREQAKVLFPSRDFH